MGTQPQPKFGSFVYKLEFRFRAPRSDDEYDLRALIPVTKVSLK